MSERRQLAVDTNALMDAVKPDGASDVSEQELKAARELGARLLTQHVVVYSKKIQQEWQAKGLVGSNKLLTDLARLDRLHMVSPRSLSGGQVRECSEHVDKDDQPFVLAASMIDPAPRVLVTRDPKTTRGASRYYVRNKFAVIVKTAGEFVSE